MGKTAENPTDRARTWRAGPLLRMTAVAVAVVAAASAIGSCGTSEPEAATEIEDVHLDAIREVVPDANLEYKRVTVPGVVNDIISPSAFSISDPGQPLVDDLLIVHETDLADVRPESRVKVTGIVYRGFNVAEVEKETGIDLDESLNQQWQGDSYIVASGVEAQ
ncbi:hypothetical protein M1E17_18420 [Arthrobacter sp. D1-29]